MSIFAVNKLCRQIFNDSELRAAIATDPQAALADFDLTDEERRLLLAGEVGRLYELGAHSFLLGHLTREQTFGLTVAEYSARMRAAKDDRQPPLEPADYLAAAAGCSTL